jgi:S-adenosylmethionine:tRNA ribosyltransferase-isomerase
MSEIDEYDHDLPRELIAQYPLVCRSDARLLVVDRAEQALNHAHVRDLPDWLRPSDCVVVNDTRVIPARLVGRRVRTGGRWVGLFLAADATGLWRVMGRTRGKLVPGERVLLRDPLAHDALSLRMLSRFDDGSWAARPESDEDALQLLERVGHVPLPPYIRGGEMVASDRASYQTVYAAKPGAVAAPTAGLHLTSELLSRLARQGVQICRLTLHVGPGTFRPVTTERLASHQMHAEWGCIDESAVQRLQRRRKSGGRIVAVGTTTVRVLETAARDGQLRPWQGETNLFIRPPFAFHAVDSLMTNFHLPKSTLLILVRTFGGHDLIRKAYQEAIRQEYRFYSYGDAMLIL